MKTLHPREKKRLKGIGCVDVHGSAKRFFFGWNTLQLAQASICAKRNHAILVKEFRSRGREGLKQKQLKSGILCFDEESDILVELTVPFKCV